jgi:hypothetical protein
VVLWSLLVKICVFKAIECTVYVSKTMSTQGGMHEKRRINRRQVVPGLPKMEESKKQKERPQSDAA